MQQVLDNLCGQDKHKRHEHFRRVVTNEVNLNNSGHLGDVGWVPWTVIMLGYV